MKLRLSGPNVRGRRVSGPLLRDVLAALVDCAQRTVRLRLEGRSTAQGPAPAWVEQAAAFDLVGVEEGSTQLVIEAPPLSKSAPDQFAQAQLFGQVHPDRSGLDLFMDSIGDALANKGDSDLFDDGLLDAFCGFRNVFRHGVDALDLVNGATLRLDVSAVGKFDTLKRGIPSDQRVVIAGKLDALRHSNRMFTLVLEEGDAVRGVVGSGVDLDLLGPLWGKTARVSGLAKFRPSGTVLRIEADEMQAANGDLSMWSKAPHPLFGDLDVRSLHREQGPRSGVSAIFGKWPGDETEEEFLKAVAEVS